MAEKINWKFDEDKKYTRFLEDKNIEDIPPQVIEVILWDLFKTNYERTETLMKPFMKPFRITTKSLPEDNMPPNPVSVLDSNFQTEEEDAEEVREDSNLYLFKTSYEAYQYWYLQEQQALKDFEQDVGPIIFSNVKKDEQLLSDYKKSVCHDIDALRDGFFVHKHPETFYEIVPGKHVANPSKLFLKRHQVFRSPLAKLKLGYHEFNTLCTIMYLPKSARSMKIANVEKLVLKLGGTIEQTTGSIDRVFIPTFGARATTWHRVHGGNKLGTDFASGVKRVLMSFKVNPLDFMFLPKSK